MLFRSYSGGISLYSKSNNLRLIYPTNEANNLNDTLTLDWSSVDNVDYYQILIDTNYNFNSPLLIDSLIPALGNNNGNQPDTEVLLNTLLTGTKYFWKTRVIAAQDTSAWTTIWNFEISETGDVINSNAENNISNIKVFPNPITNRLMIQGINDQTILTRLYNSNGQIVLEKKINQNTVLDCSSIPNGIYILNIIEANQSINKLVVKQ